MITIRSDTLLVRNKSNELVDVPSIIGPKGDPGSDADVTETNIKLALGYVPANIADTISIDDSIILDGGGAHE